MRPAAFLAHVAVLLAGVAAIAGVLTLVDLGLQLVTGWRPTP